MGIGVLLDVGFVMARPFQSMILAICSPSWARSSSSRWRGAGHDGAGGVGGNDRRCRRPHGAVHLADAGQGPVRADHRGGYLYLGLTYGGYPYLIKLLIPEAAAGMPMPVGENPQDHLQKLVFAVVACVLLSLLFPVAAPLFLSLFIGVVVRESGLTNFRTCAPNTVLYGSTFFLALLLGVLCEANTS
jgi:hypothetical protein